jgi:hypothetical protein
MNLSDGADLTLADDLDGAPKTAAGRSLIPHLSAEVFLRSQFPHFARFRNRVSQRFLAETMFSQRHGANRRRRMAVIGRAHRDGVNLIADLIKHFPVINVGLGLRKSRRSLLESFFVNIAQSDHMTVASGVISVAGSLAVNTNAGEPDFFVRRSFLGPCLAGRPNPPGSCQSRCMPQKFSARSLQTHRLLLH